MGYKATGVLALSALALLFGTLPGLAQTRPANGPAHHQSRLHPTYARHAGARIVVTRRSYLDAGTEVMPGGDRKFTDYIFPPGYNPAYRGPFDPVGAMFYPLSDPFFPRWP